MKNRFVMGAGKPARIIVSRILPGSDLLQAIGEIAVLRGVKCGFILSAVGAVEKIRVRNLKEMPDEYPITDKNRDYRTIERICEIAALSGDIYEEEGKDSSQAHVHGVFSYVENERVSAVGGHLLEGCIVAGFAEVCILELAGIKMVKRFDAETRAAQLFVQNDTLRS